GAGGDAAGHRHRRGARRHGDRYWRAAARRGVRRRGDCDAGRGRSGRVSGEFPVEQGYVWTSCSSVENGNPLFWDEEVAAEVTGGPIAPPTMLSVWFRPHHWAPGRSEPALPLQVHF